VTAVPLGLPGIGAPPRLLPARGCDCDSCPFYAGNPAAAEPLCSGRSANCDYCSCARAEDTRRTDACRTCSIRCGSRTDIAAWMHDVGGTLAFDDLEDTGARLPAGLPRFVPQVDATSTADYDRQLHWPAYGVGLRRVLSPATNDLFPRFAAPGSARTVLGLAADQLAVLIGYAEDPLVEAYWSLRHRRRLIERIAAGGWDLVLAPNASCYGNQPRTEQLLNFRRNLIMGAELTAAGVPAVANVYWSRLEDLDRYLTWVADTRPAALAVNLQTFRTDYDWDSMALPGLTYLSVTLPEQLPVILTGASRPDRIQVLAGLFGPRLHLVSQNPLQYANHGAVMTDAGRVDRQARKADLFRANVNYYAGLLKR